MKNREFGIVYKEILAIYSEPCYGATSVETMRILFKNGSEITVDKKVGLEVIEELSKLKE